MPSTADDVLADIRSTALRVASVRLRKYGLDSLRVMRQWYYARMGLRKCLKAKTELVIFSELSNPGALLVMLLFLYICA